MFRTRILKQENLPVVCDLTISGICHHEHEILNQIQWALCKVVVIAIRKFKEVFRVNDDTSDGPIIAFCCL